MRSENWLSFLGRIASNKSDSILYFLLITILGGLTGCFIQMELSINLIIGRYVAKKYLS